MDALASPRSALFRADEIELPASAGGGDRLGAIARAYLQQARRRLQAWHEAGAGGEEIVTAFTAAADRIIRYLYDIAVSDFLSRNPRMNQRCAVLAQGGYGRGELGPGSDVDLLFLYSWKVNPFVESVAEKILYTLWDTGLQVGHAVRNAAECVRLAEKDLKVKTAILDTRLVCGDEGLYGEFEAVRESEILKRHPERFFREKVRESEERHRQYGDSVYLLEPHVKEGEGGLRDFQTAVWMARVKFKTRTVREIVQKGVVTERELEDVLRSRDFLWRVRNTLHFLSNGHQDQLTFEYQERVGAVLGYHDADERRAVERFMQDYYLHAAQVHRFTEVVVDRCLERSNRYRQLRRFLGREIRPGVRIVNGELTLEDAALLEREPSNLVSLFRDAQRHGVDIASRTKSLLRQNAARLDPARDSPEVRRAFLDVLNGKSRVYETLCEMHAVGVLGSLLPEFGQLRCMVIRDFYHIYTVDEHTLRGVWELERLAGGAYRQSCDLLTQVIREIERPDVVYLAMLLHDVGKGHGHGHSDRGARLAAGVAARLALDVDQAREIERLVRHHLLMSHIAQHRDLDDERVIIEFAKHLETAETLKKLYVMTFADMKAVAPTVWNNWRDMVLRDLYVKTLEVFEKGDFVEEGREARVERAKARLRRSLSDREALRPAMEEAMRTFPSSYFLSASEETFAHHLELVRQLRAGGGEASTSVRHFPDREFTEFTVCTGDRPGLFSMITGVLTAQGLNILSAQIATSEDGIALDVFRLSHAGSGERVLDEERWERVRDTLARVLGGSLSVEALVGRSARPSILSKRGLPQIPTAVTFDDESSEHYDLIEVSTQDRVGVLYAITHTLARLGCAIHLARISTVLRHVYDVFYVTDVSGPKITDRGRLGAVCDAIVRRLEAEASVWENGK